MDCRTRGDEALISAGEDAGATIVPPAIEFLVRVSNCAHFHSASLKGLACLQLIDYAALVAFDSKIAQSIICLTFRGYVTAEDIRDMVDLLTKIETEAKVSPDRIVDLSAIAGISLNFSAITNYAVARRNAPLKNKVKAAIVAPHPLQFGFARMFQTLNVNPDISMEIFTDQNSGLTWISAGKGADN